jgi:hypothetical protein
MTSDKGFAPNPFHGVLTLANCMPGIRRTKQIGDWVAGFTGVEMINPPGRPELIYLMHVTGKLSFVEYWEQKPEKRPMLNSADSRNQVGDNIYEPINAGVFEQKPNRCHTEEEMVNDLGGEFVLISDEFWYFGCTPLVIPATIEISVRRDKRPSSNGNRTYDINQANDFLAFVCNEPQGVNNPPHEEWSNDGWRRN